MELPAIAYLNAWRRNNRDDRYNGEITLFYEMLTIAGCQFCDNHLLTGPYPSEDS